MPMESESQRRLMQGIKHGWKPAHMESPPSQAVARRFVAAGMARGAKGRERKSSRAEMRARALDGG